MHTIEIDFDVYKALTLRRETEAVSYNNVIRELLGLGQSNPSTAKEMGDWITKGVRFPEGTEFRAVYKGQYRTGRVEVGALVVDGVRYESPSAAATSITEGPVNGWRFWSCLLPGKSSWQLIADLRR